ncbi:PREDICTED: deleted in malignant brain tumors 1 protein-like [Poecilia mexicana]|uniref:deleted in malignant brain tumors 1 protein-like n=1 Tax=Poecilia mexicana TaxID=48701 RepID=UPI00072EC8C9|nr:PREDICTED: deleted in malignant brain tumors 1 protein-like [Poecilia mexicana]
MFNNIRSSGVNITASTSQIKLTGAGFSRCSGRVEVYHNSTWGTVCDDYWGLNDANVVCRELNCGTAVKAPSRAFFGQGTGQIWLDDVSCFGYETSLTQCGHRGFGIHDCGHNDDAGVICSGQIRLAGAGSPRCSGRVEVYHNNIWGTVCDDSWDLNDANVVCRELNCGTALKATSRAFFGQGTGQIWLDDVSCFGYEASLTQCGHRGFGTHNCGHWEDAGVICSDSEYGFRASSQNESSITLQWNKINNNISFVLQFNGRETFIRAPDGDGPVNHTVSSLTAGTKYTFTLFSEFENVRSSGVQLTAATAPGNPDGFIASSQDESSITLQWNKINNNISFVLQFNGRETFIRAPDGDEPVSHTVSSLSAGIKYTFTLFSVFNDIRSSGVNVTASTSSRSTSSRVCKCTLMSKTCEQTSRS